MASCGRWMQLQPYRLEIGSRLKTRRGTNPLRFLGRAHRPGAERGKARGTGDSTLVNLASQEYFGAVDLKALSLVVTLAKRFKETTAGRGAAHPQLLRQEGARDDGPLRHRQSDRAGRGAEERSTLAAIGSTGRPPARANGCSYDPTPTGRGPREAEAMRTILISGANRGIGLEFAPPVRRRRRPGDRRGAPHRTPRPS